MRCTWAALLAIAAVWAQSSGTIAGRVTDPKASAVPGAQVKLAHGLSGFEHRVTADAEGNFTFTNLPLAVYSLLVGAEGFESAAQQVAVRSNIPVKITIELKVAAHAESVKVTAFETATLVAPEATGTRMELSASAIDRMPLAPGTRGLESVLLSFPGFAADANGAIHPRGAHNQMQYVVDGMPITDQLTGSFGSSLGTGIVQTIELYTGNIPAEFGAKTAGVANITTKSGLGSGRRFSGNTELSAAGFDTVSQVTSFTGGGERFGYFASLSALKSHRFLDQVSRDNLHNGGNAERGFGRLDAQVSSRDTARLNVMAGRSSFELANLRSQQTAGQRQRQELQDFAGSLGWVHALSPQATWDATASWRTSTAALDPSAGDTPVTASQSRRLSTFTLSSRFNRLAGAHTLRGGADWQHFPVAEHFRFAVTDPAFNDPASPGFLPTLLPFDLSRGGRLFEFSKSASGTLASGFVQDQMRWRRFFFSLGLRYDDYRFLVRGHQLQPRVGLSIFLRETGTALRVSYNRLYQTPVNENLLLSNSEEATVLVSPVVRSAVGGFALIRPERQNLYEAGVQQALGRQASVNLVYYHKDQRDLHDNDNFFNTGIIFPTSLSRARVNGAEFRLAISPMHGFSGSLSATHYHVVVTPPFTGGLFLGSTALDLLTAGPFVIDHDQKLGMQANVNYTFSRHWWVASSVRYDSGLVTNPSDPAKVAADPDYADLLPYVNLGSKPPRVRPRTLVDVIAGYERLLDGKRRWEVQLQISNLFNRTALYNFQSIFVGTRLVQPRTVGIRTRWYW